jgi:hypothetical protein
MAEDAVCLGVAAESAGDAAALKRLVARVLRAEVPWLEGVIEHVCRWRGASEDEHFLDVHSAFRRARARGLPTWGKFGGQPGAADAVMFRAILLLFAAREPYPEAVVLGRDLDGVDENGPAGSLSRSRKASGPSRSRSRAHSPSWKPGSWPASSRAERRRAHGSKRNDARWVSGPTKRPTG